MQRRYSAAVHPLRVANRDIIVSRLQTGDLIKVKAETLPIIFHYGIVDKTDEGLFVLHNDPFRINAKGGNIVRDTIKKFLNNRDIVSVESTDLKTRDLAELYENLKKYKYDFINFNCEHFINFAKGNRYASQQVFKWTSIGLLTLLAYYLIRNRKI